MREVLRSALIGQPPERIYALINDIESYPRFLPWCTHAAIESQSQSEIVATLGVGRGALHIEFTTRNALQPHSAVTMKLVKGPFKSLSGGWQLTPIGDAGCRAELRLQFAFSSAVAVAIFEPWFESTAASLVDAFVKRSRVVYG